MKYNRNNFDKGRSKLLEPTTTDTTEHYKGRKQKNKGGLQGISEQNELGVVQKLRKEKTGHWTSKRDVHVLYNIIDEMTIKLIVFHVYLIECNGKKIAK